MKKELSSITKYSSSLKDLESNLLKGLDSFDFTELASQELSNFDQLDNISEEDVLQLTLQSDIPRQYYRADQFGHFNITLIYNEHFNIQIYIMNDIDTEIHDHPFTGAFRLLRGKTAHTSFSFKHSVEVEADLFKGKLLPEKTILMKSGDSFGIDKKLIHRIERLDPINITLIVTKNIQAQDESNGFVIPPYYYLKNKRNLNHLVRKLSALDYYYSIDSQNFKEHAVIFLRSIDNYSLLTCFARNNSYLTKESHDPNFKKELIKYIKNELSDRGMSEVYKDYVNFLTSRDNKKKILGQF